MKGTAATLTAALVLTTLGAPPLSSSMARPPTPTPTPTPRNVLTIHSGAEDFPANPQLDAAIRDAVKGADTPTAYFAEYLEADQFGDDASVTLAAYVRAKYRAQPIHLVIAVTNEALRFVLNYRADLFPGAPIVFAGVSVPDDELRRSGAGIAVVRVGRSYAETLRLALALHPATERVFVVATSPTQENVDVVRRSLVEFSQQVALTYVVEPTVAELLDRSRSLPPRSLVLYIWHRQSEPAAGLYPHEIARLVATAAPVPTYVTIDANVGSGAIGGVVRSTAETGIRIGALARKVLDGARAQELPIEEAAIAPVFDWRQLQRWQIDPSRLPPHALVRFETPSIWVAYRKYMIGVLMVMAGQAALISGLLVQRSRRRRAEAIVRASETALRASYNRIRQLAARLIEAQEQTRAKIARDLHDDVCQDLVGVSIGISGLRHATGEVQAAPTQAVLSRLQRAAVGVVDRIRRVSHELHPATLRLLGLREALNAYCIEVENRHDVQVACTASGDLSDLPPSVALCLFRVVQEALRNGVVHGEARRLAVSVAASGSAVELTVSDDGIGFDADAARRSGRGLGLVSMEERVHAVGGGLRIESPIGLGTKILVSVPVTRHRPVRQVAPAPGPGDESLERPVGAATAASVAAGQP